MIIIRWTINSNRQDITHPTNVERIFDSLHFLIPKLGQENNILKVIMSTSEKSGDAEPPEEDLVDDFFSSLLLPNAEEVPTPTDPPPDTKEEPTESSPNIEESDKDLLNDDFFSTLLIPNTDQLPNEESKKSSSIPKIKEWNMFADENIPPENSPAPATPSGTSQLKPTNVSDNQPGISKIDLVQEDKETPSTSRGTPVTEKSVPELSKQSEAEDFKQSRRDMPVCFKNTFDEDFFQNRNKFGLQICSVIVFDVLKLGDRVCHRNDSTSAIFPTMKRIVITKQNMRDMYQLESVKRSYYRKKLNRILKKERGNINKRSKQRKGDEKYPTKERDLKEHSFSQSYQRKKHIDENKKRPTEQFSAGGTRILPFEKRYNETNQQIKRPKQSEPPKISRVFVGKEARQKKDNIKKQPPKLLPDCFRIPKRAENTDRRYQTQDIPSTSTPLSFAPRESLSFGPRIDRFRPNPNANPLTKPRWAENLKQQKSWNMQNEIRGMNQDQESSPEDDEDNSLGTPPAPISEVEFGPLVTDVTRILQDESQREELLFPPNDANNIAQKCAWWFIKMDKEPPSVGIVNPEIDDHLCQPTDPNPFDDDDSFIGNVSDQDGEDDCQINEVSSTENLNPALTDEFCGCALLSAKYRIDENENPESFKNILLVEVGNYEKENFQVNCTICEATILGKKKLGPHLRSTQHIENLKNLSLRIMSSEMHDTIISSSGDALKVYKTPVDRVARNPSKIKPEPKKQAAHESKTSDKRKSSRRSRSRSPRRREGRERDSARYHSPKRDHSSRKVRSKSRDLMDEFLLRTNRPRRSRSRSPLALKDRRPSRTRSRSPKLFTKRRDNEIFHEKLTLTAQGKWDAAMEEGWKMMEKEEEALQRKFQNRQKRLSETPESHPSYAVEWKEFWETKYEEVKAMGKDPDDYDYVPEWKEFWSSRSVQLLHMEYNSETEAIRRKYNMDINTLRQLSKSGQPESDFVLEGLEGAPLFSASSFVIPPPIFPQQPVPMPFNRPPQIQEDFTARSMSISDNGTDEPPKEVLPVSAVTAHDVKSTWESLTGQRIVEKPHGDSKSESLSSSTFEFDGFDLVQVLQLVSGLEDQLGNLSSEINEFHRKAESLELTKRRQSYTLLQNREFCTLLLKCKEQFTEFVNADDLPKQTLQTLKLCVHLLTLILDSSASRGLHALYNDQQMNRRSKKDKSRIRANKFQLVKPAQKMAIAKLLASNWTKLGKNVCTENELESLVYGIMNSLLEEKTSPSDPAGDIDLPLPPDPVDRVVGTALPPLPTINVRAASPPRFNPAFTGGMDYSRRW